MVQLLLRLRHGDAFAGALADDVRRWDALQGETISKVSIVDDTLRTMRALVRKQVDECSSN